MEVQKGTNVFVGPIKDDTVSFDSVIDINLQKLGKITHIPQILETGIIKEVDGENALVNFSTYDFVLPTQHLAPFTDEATYYELLMELDLFYYDFKSKIIYIRPPEIDDPKDFKQEIKKGVSFNHPTILALTKDTIKDILVFYIDSSKIQSIALNGKNITIGMCKILWNFIQFAENNPSKVLKP